MSRSQLRRGPDSPSDVAVIGGGIIGLATAWALLSLRPGIKVTVLEKETTVAMHQTAHSSGVVHAGIYYKPGSLKAQLCTAGRAMIKAFCEEHQLPYEECGKLLVATDGREEAVLDELYERGLRNKVPGLVRLAGSQVTEVEPRVSARSAIHSPTTAIADFAAVARTLAGLVEAAGGRVLTDSEVVAARVIANRAVLVTRSATFPFDHVITCAGLHSDVVARLAGGGDNPQIVPFRGDYMKLRNEAGHLVRGLIYPVPDPRYPFLGIHLTRTVHGEVWIGPSAILAGAREGYSPTSFRRDELIHTLKWSGFRRLARKHWRAGAGELYRTINRRAFVKSARRFVPDISYRDVVPGPSGVRAQAVSARGDLVDDFWIDSMPPFTNVRNAPSPGATSSLAIGRAIAAAVLEGKMPTSE